MNTRYVLLTLCITGIHSCKAVMPFRIACLAAGAMPTVACATYHAVNHDTKQQPYNAARTVLTGASIGLIPVINVVGIVTTGITLTAQKEQRLKHAPNDSAMLQGICCGTSAYAIIPCMYKLLTRYVR